MGKCLSRRTQPAYDREREVYEAVRNLPDPGRTVVILHYYEDLTLKQIAEITDVNLNTVKYRLYSCWSCLKKD